jgi:hypothetical protein
MEHCAHVLEGYTDAQLRMLASAAARLPFPGAQNGFVAPVTHDVFVHGLLTVENIERVCFNPRAQVDVDLASALQRHLILTERGSGKQPTPHVQPPNSRKGKRGKQAKVQHQHHSEHLSFAASAPALTSQEPPVPLHVALEAEEAEIRLAIQESLKMT